VPVGGLVGASAAAGETDLPVGPLDEVGFAPTLPTTYRGFPEGQRLTIPYEASQERRIHGIGVYISHGVEAGRFEFETWAHLPESRAQQPRKTAEEIARQHGLKPEEVGALDAPRVLAFLWRMAGRPADWQRERLRVIVLDNYSVHKSQGIQDALPALEAAGVSLFYLPSYAPELSAIEPIWKDVKHHEMTKRSYETAGELKEAVDAALQRKAEKLLAHPSKTEPLLQRAAWTLF